MNQRFAKPARKHYRKVEKDLIKEIRTIRKEAKRDTVLEKPALAMSIQKEKTALQDSQSMVSGSKEEVC